MMRSSKAKKLMPTIKVRFNVECSFRWLHLLVQTTLQSWAAQMQVEEKNVPTIDPHTGKPRTRVTEASRLLSRCFLKLGAWHESLQSTMLASTAAGAQPNSPDGNSAVKQQPVLTPIIQYYAAATKHDPYW